MRPSSPAAGVVAEPVAGLPALEAISTPLQRLCESTRAPVTARPAWWLAWSRTHPQVEPWTVVLPGDDGLAGAAVLGRRRLPGSTGVMLLGHGWNDAARLPVRGPWAAEALARSIADALRRLRTPWRLELEQLPLLDPVAAALHRELPGSELEPGDGCPVVDLDPRRPAGSRSYHQQVRMCWSRLRRDGRATDVRVHRGEAEVAAVLPVLGDLRRRRDHAAGRVSDLDRRQGLAFWREVSLELAARGDLEVWTLAVDGRPVAYVTGLLDGATYRTWDHRFEPGTERYRPGQLLEAHVAERAAEAGFTTLDRMRGTTTQKMRTASAVVPAQRLRAWSSPALRRLDAAREQVRASAHRVRDAHPAAGVAYRRLKRATVLRGAAS